MMRAPSTSAPTSSPCPRFRWRSATTSSLQTCSTTPWSKKSPNFTCQALLRKGARRGCSTRMGALARARFAHRSRRRWTGAKANLPYHLRSRRARRRPWASCTRVNRHLPHHPSQNPSPKGGWERARSQSTGTVRSIGSGAKGTTSPCVKAGTGRSSATWRCSRRCSSWTPTTSACTKPSTSWRENSAVSETSSNTRQILRLGLLRARLLTFGDARRGKRERDRALPKNLAKNIPQWIWITMFFCSRRALSYTSDDGLWHLMVSSWFLKNVFVF